MRIEWRFALDVTRGWKFAQGACLAADAARAKRVELQRETQSGKPQPERGLRPNMRQCCGARHAKHLKLAEDGDIHPNVLGISISLGDMSLVEETALKSARDDRRGSIKCLWQAKSKCRKIAVALDPEGFEH
jgi:hypothetical protein